MGKSILLSITISDDRTGKVSEQIIKTRDLYYGYEVNEFFSEAAEQVIDIVDPNYNKDE